MALKIVAISDTHSYHRKISVPDGDVLVFAGDITWKGELDIIADFVNWLRELPHKHKCVIFGNHELGFQHGFKRIPAINMIKEAGAHYLEDSGVEIEGKLFWGSPWQPWFHDWEWNLPRGEKLAKRWAMIPKETNVLLCHGPPFGIGSLDLLDSGERVGCEELTKRIKTLPELELFVCGHIHSGYSKHIENNVTFVNAASCDEQYNPINPPIIVDL